MSRRWAGNVDMRACWDATRLRVAAGRAIDRLCLQAVNASHDAEAMGRGVAIPNELIALQLDHGRRVVGVDELMPRWPFDVFDGGTAGEGKELGLGT